MRAMPFMIVVCAIAISAWYLLRDGGLIEQVTEERVEQALLDNQVPVPLARCMAPRLVDRLSIMQLMKLERIAPQEGESRVPTSPSDAIERLRRVDDDVVVAQLISTASACGLGLILEGF